MGVTPAFESAQADLRLAFEAVFEAEVPYVIRTLRRLGVPERDLEDLAHEVFVTGFRRFAEFDASRPVRPWLFGIAFRVAAGFRRLARHQHEVLAAGEDCEAAHSPSPSSEIEARDLVLRALHELSLEQRAVFVLHELDGQGVPEIAELLQIPLNTAYTRLRAARRDFRATVERIFPERGAV